MKSSRSFKVEICGVEELTSKFKSKEFDVVVSIRDPVISLQTAGEAAIIQCMIAQHCSTVYLFEFKDIRGRRNTSPDAPDLDNVTEMYEAIRMILDESDATKILVHCAAGISRSSAFAYMFWRTVGLNNKKAREKIRLVRPQARPNERIIHLFTSNYSVHV